MFFTSRTMQPHMPNRAGLPSYSSIDHGRTVRPVATSLLTIDSEDRFQNYTAQFAAVDGAYNVDPYNFTITKTESLIATPPTRIAVTEVVFPWTVSNVNLKTNKIYAFLKATGGAITQTTITLGQRFYRPSELAAAMQTAVLVAFGASIPAFTMVYGYNNQPVFAYDSGTAAFSIAFGYLPYNSAVYPHTSATKQLFQLLGMTYYNSNANPAFITDTLANQTIQTGITYCQFTRYIDIVCQQLTGLQGIRDTTSQPIVRDSLCRVYVVNPSDVSNVDCSGAEFCPPGCAAFTLYRNFTLPKQIQWIPNQPVAGGLTFTVYADDGEPLGSFSAYTAGGLFGNSTNWSMTLQCTEN